MFAFPQQYARPASGFYSPRQRSRPQPQQRAYDPFSSLFGGRSMYGYDDDAYLQRQKLEEQRRLEEEQRRQQLLLAQQQKQQAHLEERKRKLRVFHAAAKVIQRAFRAFKLRKQRKLEDKASLVVTTAVRNAGAVKTPKRIAKSLRQLKQKRDELHAIAQTFYTNPRGYRNTLFFIDRVEKLIFSLDDLPHYQSDFVRAQRKTLVQEAQIVLKVADVVLQTQRRSARAIAAWWKQAHSKMVHDTEDSAARHITTFMRAVPKVAHAKRVRSALADIKAKQIALSTLRAQYLTMLSELDAQLSASQDQVPDTTLAYLTEQLRTQVTTDHAALTTQPTTTATATTTTTPLAEVSVGDESEEPKTPLTPCTPSSTPSSRRRRRKTKRHN